MQFAEHADMELPQYTARPKKARALLPEALKLLALGAVFYVGILLNMNLLEISFSANLNIIIMSAIAVLVALQLLLSYLSLSRTSYDFYLDRIEISGKRPRSAHYYDISAPKIMKGTFDRIFGTGSIILAPKMRLDHIDKPDAVLNYLQGMMSYQSQK